MNRKSLRVRGFSSMLLSALIVGTACAGKTGPARSVDELRIPTDSLALSEDSETFVSIRFGIALDSAVLGPIYVLLNGEDGQLGWVKAFRDGERIYFRERCEIEDCGVSPAVCGAAIPLVRDIAAGRDRRILEFVWDGMTSVLDRLSGCETREPGPRGKYIARFCYSGEAEFDGNRDPTGAVPGRLIHATCVEKPFTLDHPDVVLRISSSHRTLQAATTWSGR